MNWKKEKNPEKGNKTLDSRGRIRLPGISMILVGNKKNICSIEDDSHSIFEFFSNFPNFISQQQSLAYNFIFLHCQKYCLHSLRISSTNIFTRQLTENFFCFPIIYVFSGPVGHKLSTIVPANERFDIFCPFHY